MSINRDYATPPDSLSAHLSSLTRATRNLASAYAAAGKAAAVDQGKAITGTLFGLSASVIIAALAGYGVVFRLLTILFSRVTTWAADVIDLTAHAIVLGALALTAWVLIRKIHQATRVDPLPS